MYTMTVAPGADASGSFYSLKAAFAAMPEDPGGSRNHPRHARNLPRKIIPHTPERHDRGRRSIPVRHRDLLRRLRLRDHAGRHQARNLPLLHLFRACRRRHAAQLNHREYCRRLQNARGRQSHSTPNATVLSRNPAAFSDIRIRFLPVRFPRRNTSPAASAGRPSPHRASTADNIITTAISAAISTLFSAVRPLTLKAVRSHP